MDFRTSKACIFDFDGVIVDSERMHARAKEMTLQYFKLDYPSDIFEQFKGRPDHDFFEHAAEVIAKGEIKKELMLEYKKSRYKSLFEEIQLVEEVQDFILFARAHFERLGITTSTTFHDYKLAVQKFDIAKYFDFIITDEDTLHHKPHPEPYLLAAEKLGLEKAKAIVIEDSPNGILSAKTAGFPIVGITTSFSDKELLEAGANTVVDSFEELKELLLR